MRYRRAVQKLRTLAEAHPQGADWLIDALRLDKGRPQPLLAFPARSRVEPPHSRPGPVLVGQRRRRRGATVELDAALARLREAHQNYRERDWRREHRGNHRYPENELWDAVDGYLDLLDATRPPDRLE